MSTGVQKRFNPTRMIASPPTPRFISISPSWISMCPIKHAATLVLIGEELGKDPAKLAPVIAEQKISIWYSTPSILSLLAQYGKIPQYNYESLRVVHFAGSVPPQDICVP